MLLLFANVYLNSFLLFQFTCNKLDTCKSSLSIHFVAYESSLEVLKPLLAMTEYIYLFSLVKNYKRLTDALVMLSN